MSQEDDRRSASVIRLESVPHIRDVADLSTTLATDLTEGLSQAEATHRLHDHGPNRLPEPEKVSPLRLVLKQFANYMMYILLGAALLSLALGKFPAAIAIAVVVLVTVGIGFVQEYKAEQALASLKQLAGPVATVVRDDQIDDVPAWTLVPGDLVLLEEGDSIPADIRLTEALNLALDEAILTGESLPVEKSAERMTDAGLAVSEQRNMVFLGTVVRCGRGKGIVVATGSATQVGRIAETLATPLEKPTPLQIKLDALGKVLVWVTVVLCALIAVIGIVQGRPLEDMVLTSISLAVAVIPEGLSAVVAVTMALGVQRMARRHAIVRNLPAVETLGAVTTICSDKTGTLTEGRMVATDLWVAGTRYQVTGTGLVPEGSIMLGDRPVTHTGAALALPVLTMALCNNAVLQQDDDGVWEAVGDPTEVALQVVAQKVGVVKEALVEQYRLLAEWPFDSRRKRMSVAYKAPNGQLIVLTKGAPEAVLAACSEDDKDGVTRALNADIRAEIQAANDTMAAQGLRVLGLAYRIITRHDEDDEPEDVEHRMRFLGLIGLVDPPRPEAQAAIAQCRTAGIEVLMITGDHQATALYVAQQLGIFDATHSGIMHGRQLDELTEAQLARQQPMPRVFARVSPENKLMLVKALREQGQVVAMTGDGVNDAPAIKHANAGVAMGRAGTDVTKDAADVILSDDNFATIVTAVAEGRRIFDNIRKFVIYMLACHAGGVMVVLLAIAAGIAVPFTALQILWLNLVTGTPPALALGFDPAAADVMRRPPRRPQQGILSRLDVTSIVFHGAIMGLLTLGIFFVELYVHGGAIERARTLAFTMLALVQLAHAFNARSETQSILQTGLLGNRWLLGALSFSLVLLLLGIYLPGLRDVMEKVPLSVRDWLELGVGVAIFTLLAELFKLWRRRVELAPSATAQEASVTV
jgi:Ca2+-transporting ATPase